MVKLVVIGFSNESMVNMVGGAWQQSEPVCVPVNTIDHVRRSQNREPAGKTYRVRRCVFPVRVTDCTGGGS